MSDRGETAAEILRTFTPIEVRHLPRREQKALLMRAARSGTAPPRSYEKIGAAIGVSSERARQIINRTVLYLRTNRERMQIEERHADLIARRVQRSPLVAERPELYPIEGSGRRESVLRHCVEVEERRAAWEDRDRDRAEARAERRSPDREHAVLENRGPSATPEDTAGNRASNRAVVPNHVRNEILEFVTEAIADRGVAAVQLKDIFRFRPRSQFNACFEGKDDCVQAALEAAMVDFLTVAGAGGIGALLQRVREKPAHARIVFVEGRSIDLETSYAFLAELCDRLVSPVAINDELHVGGVVYLIEAALRRGDLGSLEPAFPRQASRKGSGVKEAGLAPA